MGSEKTVPNLRNLFDRAYERACDLRALDYPWVGDFARLERQVAAIMLDQRRKNMATLQQYVCTSVTSSDGGVDGGAATYIATFSLFVAGRSQRGPATDITFTTSEQQFAIGNKLTFAAPFGLLADLPVNPAAGV